MPHASAHDGQLVVKRECFILDACHQKGDKKYYHNGNIIKAHRYPEYILKEYPQSQIQYQKNQDRNKCLRVAFIGGVN